jgi:hypothetical protein
MAIDFAIDMAFDVTIDKANDMAINLTFERKGRPKYNASQGQSYNVLPNILLGRSTMPSD